MIARKTLHCWLWTALASAVSLIATPPDVAAQFNGPEAEEVRAREMAFAQTMADRDFDAFVTFISAEAVFFNGNEPLRGIERIVEDWRKYFEGDVAPFSWSPDLVQVVDGGALAFSSGPVVAASGDVAGRFNSIWRKELDGQWRVVFDKGS
jgi:ketosteroid isomerase-like protein